MNKNVRLVLGIAVSVLCFWILFRGFDFHTLKTTLAEARYIWFLPAIALFFLNMTLRGIRWHALLTPIKPIRFAITYPALIMGFFMNNVLPARGGEVVRAVLVTRRAEMPASSVVGSIIAERLGDMTGVLLVILLASRLLPWSRLPVKPMLTMALIGAIISIVFVWFARKHHSQQEHPSGWRGKLATLFTQLTEGFLAFQSIGKVAFVLVLSWLIWINEMLMPFFISRAMHLNLGFFETAGLMAGVSVGVMIPAAPGYIGTYEFFGKSVLVMLGHAADAALSFVVVLHFFQLTMMALLALASFLITGSQRDA